MTARNNSTRRISAVTFPRAAWKEILGWLVREENSDGRRKYLHALAHSTSARRRLNSHTNLHLVRMRECGGTAMLTRSNSDWNKNTNHPSVRTCYNSVEPGWESFWRFMGLLFFNLRSCWRRHQICSLPEGFERIIGVFDRRDPLFSFDLIGLNCE